jgi:hypothetical protein
METTLMNIMVMEIIPMETILTHICLEGDHTTSPSAVSPLTILHMAVRPIGSLMMVLPTMKSLMIILTVLPVLPATTSHRAQTDQLARIDQSVLIDQLTQTDRSTQNGQLTRTDQSAQTGQLAQIDHSTLLQHPTLVDRARPRPMVARRTTVITTFLRSCTP